MQTDRFELEIFTPEKADVYLSHSDRGPDIWPLVKRLDQARIRAIGDSPDLDPDDQRLSRIISGCCGMAVMLPHDESEPCTTDVRLLGELRLGAQLGVPLAIFRARGVRVSTAGSEDTVSLRLGDGEPISLERHQLHGPEVYAEPGSDLDETLPKLDSFMAHVVKDKDRLRPYAFFIGRLERDFALAREAIRAAVEDEAGIPCLWSDDGRHRTNIDSVRERTRLLIKHAVFVVADLTLGSESPERENPSRAHEIGMAMAYDRPLMLCSQEPRRYPYFSIGDLQMTFWSTEAELEREVRQWIHTRRHSVAQSTFNARLAGIYGDYEPALRPRRFSYDAKRRYVGPNTRTRGRVQPSFLAAAFGVIALAALAFLTYLMIGLRFSGLN